MFETSYFLVGVVVTGLVLFTIWALWQTIKENIKDYIDFTIDEKLEEVEKT